MTLHLIASPSHLCGEERAAFAIGAPIAAAQV
jgi:hypothetical protein